MRPDRRQVRRTTHKAVLNMAINSFFSTSVLGMRSQALALEVVGTNVSNIQSGGYRRGDTTFATVLSKNIGGSTDNNGTIPNYYQRISQQGQIQASARNLDVAISGTGFFVTNTTLDQSGQQVYTRDGSFNLSAENPFTVTDPDTGTTYLSSEAYIVDKNGNYLLGYAREADGTFPTTGALVPIRVDQNAFSDAGQATSLADLVLNLPSEGEIINDHLAAISALNSGANAPEGIEDYTIDFIDSLGNRKFARLNFTKSSTNDWEVSASYQGTPVTKVDEIQIGGTLERNDQYTIGISDIGTVSYSVSTGDTLSDVTNALIAAFNADTDLSAEATATAGTTAGTIVITGATADEVYTVTASTTNGSPTPQESLVTVGGTVAQGKVYNVVIDGTTVSYTAGAGDTITDVRNNLVTNINAAAPPNTIVTASNGAGTGEIVLTGVTDGDDFTLSSNVDVPQQDTITIGTPTAFEAGDTYDVNVNGTVVTYTTLGTETSVADIRNGLIAQINANGTINAFATASAGATAGQILLTNTTAGGTHTTIVTPNDNGTASGIAISVATTIANGPDPDTTAIADALTEAAATPNQVNTADVTTTRASGGGYVTTAVTQLAFTGDGQAGVEVGGTLTSPDPITLTFAFPASGSTAASTASFDLDVAGLTQFSAPFTPKAYDRNGFEAAELESVTFDSEGHVVGQFANGTGVRLYKIPLARFPNENGLEAINGMSFVESAESGEAVIETVDANGTASFLPFAHELSNVSLTDEFTKMIQTQVAYNSSANAFRTQDEMLELLNQMKR
ncbi:MAG: flagellar hook-basal body complex protein [Rhodospirillales bacterium]